MAENEHFNIPRSVYPRVVIIGGGFGGLTLARKLAGYELQVVLIDRNNHHKFQPLLYQVATSSLATSDIAFPFRKIFHGKHRVIFRMAEVTAIDPSGKTVTTPYGSLGYDILVLANGSAPNFFGMENIKNHALPMKEMSDAIMIRNRVLANLEKASLTEDPERRHALLNVVIVGGGPTGTELAGALAEMKRYIVPEDFPEDKKSDFRVILIEGSDRLMASMSEKTSGNTLKSLRKMGVEVILGSHVTDYIDGKAVLGDSRTIPTGCLIWTSGVAVEIPAGLSGATFAKSGRVLTDDYLKVNGHEDVYAIGDCCYQSSQEFPNGYPQLARTAMEQAGQLAGIIRARTRGKESGPFRFRKYPVMATIGRNHAYMEYGKFWLKGFLAWILWVFIHLFLLLGTRNKINVLWGWFWNYVTRDNPDRLIIPTGDNIPDKEF